LSFWKQGDIFCSLTGIALTIRPGDYFLELNIKYEDGLIFGKKYKLTVKDKQFRIQHLTVDPRYIHLTREDLARVQRESVLLREVYMKSSKEKLWNGSFIEPINSEINSPFGLRRTFNNQPRGRHSGVDLQAGMGAPIKSSNRGKVVLARNLFFAGNCVIIDHGLDIFSIYCHLSKISVQEGEIVEKGHIIGLAGATGRVTGPHLHWSIKVGGINIAPFSLLYLNLE
jgi:murein DD-endopeptidase MepM/ murein hydrolase activator NlpD